MGGVGAGGGERPAEEAAGHANDQAAGEGLEIAVEEDGTIHIRRDGQPAVRLQRAAFGRWIAHADDAVVGHPRDTPREALEATCGDAGDERWIEVAARLADARSAVGESDLTRS